jgi:hypothetical protein
MAAWQTPIKGAPMRVVIRCDGNILDHRANFIAPGSFSNGFPCGVLNVRYASGGYVRETLVDCVNQSALVVWADNVEVTAQWDRRRIARMFPGSIAPLVPRQLPCLSQALASAISVDDQGEANARWLDAIFADVANPGGTFWSIHPIPPGARAIRILRGVRNPTTVFPAVPGNIAQYEGYWSANNELPTAPFALQGVVDRFTNPCYDAAINIPAGSEFLILLHTDIDTVPFNSEWVEFLLLPEALYTECCCDIAIAVPIG